MNRTKKYNDILYISQLEMDTIIGIYDWERRQRQIVCVDLEIATDIRPGAQTDHIDDALNYKAITKRIISVVTNSRYNLIEALAEHIAHIILTEFHVSWLRLKLSKPGALRWARDVGVIIERSATDST